MGQTGARQATRVQHMARPAGASIESGRSWQAAFMTVAIFAISFGSPLLTVVGLRDMQETMHVDRSILALASALVWVGNGIGGIPMGWLADRMGIRRTVTIGVLAMGSGLALSSTGSVWALYVGHGLLIGLLGNGAIYAPLMVHVSRWFDRRRGTAIALISSGQYVAGIIWPSLLERGMKHFGWQSVMLGYAVVVMAILPMLLSLGQPPEPIKPGPGQVVPRSGDRVCGFQPNIAMALICTASFLCCVPMGFTASHLVAFCGDVGLSPSHGAAMLSVLLACAFVSRQFWGAFADRYGGLRTIMAGSTAQMLATGAFLLTRDELGLFAIASALGLGFSGIIPSYSVTIRDLYSSKEASWRIPTVLLTAMSGMAFGSWLGGRLFDMYLSYRPAFAYGVLFNLANVVLIAFLVSRTARKPTVAMSPITP
jgi:MFS family permease